MKRRILMCVMMAAMVAASVNLTGCSKSDSDSTTEQPSQPKSLTGTWVCLDKAMNTVSAALTFDNSNYVLAHFEGAWFFGEMTRTESKMTLKADLLQMESYTDFGSFKAKKTGSSTTITFDCAVKDGVMTISSIRMQPDMMVPTKQSYELNYDRIYSGGTIIY